jgi:HTH-type transcriptional regulator/antitoxin HigA
MSDLGEEPQVAAAMRKSEKQTVCLTAPQRAWCFRTLAMAEQQKVEPFSHRRIDACQRALRKLLGSPDGCSNVAAVLASYGIRFVVVEHLTGTKIDGAAMWLNSRFPVIGMSLRYDRIDYFWFTLFHELAHIRNRDCLSCDTEFGSSSSKDSRPDFEQRADAEAADTIIPTPNLEAFIKTAGPGFSTDDVVAFAEEVGVHPGLVVGQLQYRGEIGYQSHRAFLVKVRELVTNTTDTDGWA